MYRTIQPCQPGTKPGEYDVLKSLPYPYHISEDGAVERQDFWRGTPEVLIGFQKDVEVQTVDLWCSDWFEGGADEAVGMYPVFRDSDGTLWNDSLAVSKVHETA